MLLAIDTSTNTTGLACYDASGLLGECVWAAGREHTAQLLPQLNLLLANLGRSKADLAAIAVALGPGSWSGLRVGVSTAKAIALARDLPLLGVSTLDAIAYQQRRPGLPIYPLIRLGRERFATARYAAQAPWLRSGEYRNETLAEICAGVSGRALFCGDISGEVQAQIQQVLGAASVFPLPAANLRRPGFLAELAWQRHNTGQADDRATLEPIYLGQPVTPRS